MLKIVALLLAVTVVTALEPYDKFREGSCSKFPTRGVKADRKFVDSLKYLSAGSRYHRYRTVADLPNYRSMREDEFHYYLCATRNTTTIRVPSISAVFGFGKVLDLTRVTTRPGIYAEYSPLEGHGDRMRLTVTLTDQKTFAFFTGCFLGVDQRSWVVVTNTPSIDKKTEKIIEDHAISLGFRKDYITFSRYDSCKNIILDEPDHHSGHQSGHHNLDHGSDHLDLRWVGNDHH